MSWDTSEISPNSHRVNFLDISSGWEHYVMLSADRHHDNQHTNQRFEKRQLELARQRNAPIIDIGDLFCAMQGKYDKRSSQHSLREEHRTDDYFGALLDTAESFYQPYADLFAVIGTGNHETSILKHNNLDLTKMLCKRLSRHSERGEVYKGGYGGYVVFRFHMGTQRQAIKMKYYHGSGGGGPVTRGTIQTNRRAVMYPDADIVASGHIHEAWYLTIPRERCNQLGATSIRTQHHISVPTYKEEYGSGAGGWHVERGAPPKPLGCAWLKFRYESGVIKMTVELDTLQ